MRSRGRYFLGYGRFLGEKDRRLGLNLTFQEWFYNSNERDAGAKFQWGMS